jgi:superfamily II DNA or RNA helicase
VIRKELRQSQTEAVRRWEKSPSYGFIFLHEQRAGKTLPALACVVLSKAVQLLVITTKKGISVWEKEIRESLPSNWTVDRRILNYSQLQNKSTIGKLKRWMRKRPTFMIVDEAHHIKRRGSKWSRRCRSLAHYADHRLALTGTLIAQGIQDAWAVFDYIDPAILGKWAITERKEGIIRVVGGFQHKYLLMHPKWRSKVIGYQNEEEFKEILHRHSYRITLREAQRQAGQRPTLIRRRYFKGELSATSRRHYNELEETLRTTVRRKRIETPLAITLAMKLQQICGGFIIDENGAAIDLGGHEKLGLLSQAVDAVPYSERFIVVCRFLHEVDWITRLLKRRKVMVTVIKGGTDFDASTTITTRAVILQIQSGEAIDLAFAKYLIFYSWDYSHINHEQVRFRVLKFSSQRVSYYYLVMKNTVDELILKAVLEKKNFAALICDYYRRS